MVSKAVILAGGEGTRLRPLTLTRPKSMIPLAHKPVIEHLISRLCGSGFSEIVLTVNYLKEQIMHYVADGSRFGAKVGYSIEPENVFLGTAGGVKLANHLLNETFLVLQGDSITSIDLQKALRFHKNSKADATIVLKEVPDPWNYGVAQMGSDGRITMFQEKPRTGEVAGGLASTGIYCLEPEVLDYVPAGECDFAKNVFPQLLGDGKGVFGFIDEEFWADVGSLRGYLEGSREVLRERISKDDQYRSVGNASVCIDVNLPETTQILGPSLIEDQVSIGENSRIGPFAVLKKGARIGEYSTVENSAIFEGVTVSAGCKISDSIVGERAFLQTKAIVNGSVIGPGANIGEAAQIRSGSRVWPGIKVVGNTIIDGSLTLPIDKPFYLYSEFGRYTGLMAEDIPDLIKALEIVEIQSVEFHLCRRDFERWIRDVFHANSLAQRISTIRKENLEGEELRSKLTGTIRDWLKYSMESSRH